MNQRLIAGALCASILAITACGRDAETTAPAPVPAETSAPAATADAKPGAEALPTDVISEVDNSSAPAGFDVKGFAGTFTGTLPCADCPGIETTLELKPDGSYVLQEAYLESGNVGVDGDGTWTVEENGAHIRLDPNSKDDDDRLYAIVGNDELQMLDAEGNPPQSGLDYSLERSSAQE